MTEPLAFVFGLYDDGWWPADEGPHHIIAPLSEAVKRLLAGELSVYPSVELCLVIGGKFVRILTLFYGMAHGERIRMFGNPAMNVYIGRVSIEVAPGPEWWCINEMEQITLDELMVRVTVEHPGEVLMA